jgi:hypothetical protein
MKWRKDEWDTHVPCQHGGGVGQRLSPDPKIVDELRSIEHGPQMWQERVRNPAHGRTLP